MARRKLIWHLGLAQAPRAVIAANLAEHAAAIEEAGVRLVASADEAERATHEILRTHRQAGLPRREVEGAWARICDRVWDHKGVSMLSTPGLCAADKDQLRFALDPLIGIEVHLVVTVDSFSQQLYGGWLAGLRAGRSTAWDTYVARVLDHAVSGTRDHAQAEQFWAGHELASVLARWGWTFHTDRLHVVADQDVTVHWSRLAALAGLPVAALPCVVPPYADPAGVAVLRKVNRQLDAPVDRGSLELLVRPDPEREAAPVASTASLRPLVERWQAMLSQAGYDLRGDLSMLIEEGEGPALPGPRDQLAVAVDALADALVANAALRSRVTGLERERDRLDRKRRKWKSRARSAHP